MARTLREVNMNSIKMEIELKGNSMCLMVKEKKPVGSMPNEWKAEHEINLLDEIPATAATPFQMKERGKSILVTMNADLSTPDVLKTLLQNKLAEFDDLVYNEFDKKKAVIDCKRC